MDSSKPRYFPRFLYKVSTSYYIRTGDYASGFLLEMSDKMEELFGRRTKKGGGGEKKTKGKTKKMIGGGGGGGIEKVSREEGEKMKMRRRTIQKKTLKHLLSDD